MSTFKKRVLMLIQNQSLPQDIRVLHESLALISNGYRVSTICPARPDQPGYEVVNNIAVYRFPSVQFSDTLHIKNELLNYLVEYGWSLIAMFFISLRVFIKPGFDIIHIGNPPDIFFPIVIFYKMFGKRIVFDQHDLSPELFNAKFTGKGNKFIYSMLVWFERLSCIWADHIITTNQSQKAILIKRHHICGEKITIVRNGPLASFANEKPISGLQQDRKSLITYVGVTGIQDGVDHLIRAVHYMVYQLNRSDFICVILGNGDAYNFLRSLAEELKVTSFIMFTGWIADHKMVRRYLNTSDICIAPEPSNPLNDCSTVVKMMEYMASAKPIVAFDLPEHRITAQDGAVYAQPNDDRDLAMQIITLMDDPDRRRKMGQINLERLEKELLWSHQADCLLSAYQVINRS
jgi:glycosyltransferase involved in cell wall biosynthesis